MKMKNLSLSAALLTASLLSFQNCSRGFGSAAGSSADSSETKAGPGYDIVVIAGQSNAVGYGCGPYTNVSTSEDSRIFQVDPSGNVIPAQEPLYFTVGHKNLVGFGLTFARLYAQERLAPERKIILVPVAFGGTSIQQWDTVDQRIEFGSSAAFPADSTDLWDRMVQRTGVALAYEGADNRIVGLLWHQGENDYASILGAQAPYTGLHAYMPSVETYKFRLLSFFSLFRASFAGGRSLPIVSGPIGSFWNNVVGYDAGGALLNQFNSGLQSVQMQFANSVLVSASGLSSDAQTGCSSDNAHFSAASQIEFGKRYFAAFRNLTEVTSKTISSTYDPGVGANCEIAGGNGSGLFSGILNRAQCNAQCQAQITTHPNLVCLWQNEDLAPVGNCVVSEGATALFDTSLTRGDCYAKCVFLQAAHPSETCRWNDMVY